MKRFVFICLLFVVVDICSANNSKQVLFVGNSYTYFNDMPGIVAQLARANGQKLITEKIVQGGAKFQDHYEQGQVQEVLKNGNWDSVVFQNQSFQAISNCENMMKYGMLLADCVDRENTQIVYFQTWQYKAPVGWMKKESGRKYVALVPEMDIHLSRAYSDLARQTKGLVAPVGDAWKFIRENHPDIELYTPDNSHPSAYGSYLTALVFYAALYNQPPKVVPISFRIPPGRKSTSKEPTVVKLSMKVHKAFIAAVKTAFPGGSQH